MPWGTWRKSFTSSTCSVVPCLDRKALSYVGGIRSPLKDIRWPASYANTEFCALADGSWTELRDPGDLLWADTFDALMTRAALESRELLPSTSAGQESYKGVWEELHVPAWKASGL